MQGLVLNFTHTPQLPPNYSALAAWTPTPTMMEIKAVVAGRYGVTVADLESSCRKRQWAYPRQIAMFLCRELTTCSYPQIGRAFGGRDHTTILFACRKLRRLKGGDHKLVADLPALRIAALEVAARKRPPAIRYVDLKPIALPAETQALFSLAAKFKHLPARELVS